MDKRYQVFVSSTYTDLKEERQLVTQTLMKMDCIPAGMELFPASDENQFEFIKRVIDDCDYYLLIIGGRYGSVTTEGISYTEKEYDYAVEKGLKVVGLLHRNPDSIPIGKSESTPEAREKLAAFRDKVSKGRLVDYWEDAPALPGIVALSMVNAMRTFPGVGWVRANKAASEDLLGEINALRKENDRLEEELAEADENPPIPENLASLDELFIVHGTTVTYSGVHRTNQKRNWTREITWRKLFEKISPYLLISREDSSVRDLIKENLISSSGSTYIDDQDFQTIKLQFQALNLVEVRYAKSVGGGWHYYWSSTSSGKALTMDLRTVKKGEKEKITEPQ